MASSKRISKELAELTKEPLDGITVSADDSNVYQWSILLQGPPDTPYNGGYFKLALDFPVEYPFKAPKVRFLTKIYHPNIDADGNLCLGIIKSEAWKPSTKAATVLQSIRQLIGEPNPDDALVASIAEKYKTDRAAYDKTAAEHTKLHAKKP